LVTALPTTEDAPLSLQAERRHNQASLNRRKQTMTETANIPSPTKERSPLLATFMTVFIDLIGFSILLPVFPLLIGTPQSQQFRVTPLSWSPHTGLIMLGWLQAVYPLCIFFAAPILGQLSDRLGRRPVLAISIAGTAVGYVIFAIGIATKNIPLLFIGRSVDGFTGGNIAVAQAAIGDVSTDKNRAKNFGLIGAAFGLGFIFGPYIGGRLSAPNVSFYRLFTTPHWFGATTPFWFAAILAGLNAAFVFFTFPETLKTRSKGRVKAGVAFKNVVSGFASPRLRVPLLSAFCWVCGFTFFTTFFGVYVANRFGFSPATTGDYFAIIGVFIALVQGAVVGMVAKKFPDYKILKFAIPFQALSLLAYALVTKSSMLYFVIPWLALFQGLGQANFGALMSRSAEPGRQGEAMGIYSSVTNLAQFPPAVLLGYIAGSLRSNTPLLVAAALTVASFVIFAAFFRPTFVAGSPSGAGGPSAH
jgi:MFS transporter, DHA1 family, tetracycline resistance protein